MYIDSHGLDWLVSFFASIRHNHGIPVSVDFVACLDFDCCWCRCRVKGCYTAVAQHALSVELWMQHQVMDRHELCSVALSQGSISVISETLEFADQQ